MTKLLFSIVLSVMLLSVSVAQAKVYEPRRRSLVRILKTANTYYDLLALMAFNRQKRRAQQVSQYLKSKKIPLDSNVSVHLTESELRVGTQRVGLRKSGFILINKNKILEIPSTGSFEKDLQKFRLQLGSRLIRYPLIEEANAEPEDILVALQTFVNVALMSDLKTASLAALAVVSSSDTSDELTTSDLINSVSKVECAKQKVSFSFLESEELVIDFLSSEKIKVSGGSIPKSGKAREDFLANARALKNKCESKKINHSFKLAQSFLDDWDSPAPRSSNYHAR